MIRKTIAYVTAPILSLTAPACLAAASCMIQAKTPQIQQTAKQHFVITVNKAAIESISAFPTGKFGIDAQKVSVNSIQHNWQPHSNKAQSKALFFFVGEPADVNILSTHVGQSSISYTITPSKNTQYPLPLCGTILLKGQTQHCQSLKTMTLIAPCMQLGINIPAGDAWPRDNR